MSECLEYQKSRHAQKYIFVLHLCSPIKIVKICLRDLRWTPNGTDAIEMRKGKYSVAII